MNHRSFETALTLKIIMKCCQKREAFGRFLKNESQTGQSLKPKSKASYRRVSTLSKTSFIVYVGTICSNKLDSTVDYICLVITYTHLRALIFIDILL